MIISSPTYLHVSTRRSALDVAGWHPEKMGLAIAATLSAGHLRIFTEDTVHELIEFLKNAECVVGYNLYGFDLRVLRGIAMSEVNHLKCVDMLLDLEAAAGTRVNLNSVCAATLGHARCRGGLDSVRAWKAGDVISVIEDTCNRVLDCQGVHLHGITHGQISFQRESSDVSQAVEIAWQFREGALV